MGIFHRLWWKFKDFLKEYTPLVVRGKLMLTVYQVPRGASSLLMEDSDNDETVLFGESEARKPLTSARDEEESD